ncbi:Hypothetical protein NTJ_03552 [Nesidiocoris tenuis]|uniref:Uncharacterized protein n=1 Tax=Nesidiocoris tenuis TaxID=355587 RepID=A0ABN7AES4_9HEMI|nr:Hypothetical protein NTJ_03552 [Nesidiocoris tenuis]
MTSRPDALSVLWPFSSFFLFALLVGQVRGIARASRPVVFSYSSGGNSNHPAVISHHYRPLPVDPPTRPPDVQIVERFPTHQTLTRTSAASEYTESVIDKGHSPEENDNPDEPPTNHEISYSNDPPEKYVINNDAISSVSHYHNRRPNGSEHVSSGQMIHENSEFGEGFSHEEVRDINKVPNEDYRQQHGHAQFVEPTTSFEATPEHTVPYGATPFVPTSSYKHKGGLTYTSTPIYNELGSDHDIDIDPDYVSTTPLPMFESMRNKLPGINEYPPPNRGYITSPFPTSSQINSGINDKILQQPKYFAYSNDIPSADNSGGDGASDYNADRLAHGNEKAAEKHVKGGGQEHHSNQEAADGAEGEKGYKSHHAHDSGDKGHHDKETHKGKYKDEKGVSGKKKELAAHYDATHQAEKGKKSAKYGESGEHKKGHSTKGEHNIHTKDEYLKKHVFYDEHHEGGDHEKIGGFKSSHGHSRGSKKKKGHKKSGFRHRHKGKKGFREKGGSLQHQKRRKGSVGVDDHNKYHKKYRSKGGRKHAKKWGFSSPGHPEK